MDTLKFINETYPESKGRIDDKCNLTWNNIVFLLGVFQEEHNKVNDIKQDVMHRFPDNPEIWKWWKEQKFQKEQGEQEYTMIYEIDLPKILKAFTEHLLNGA